MLNPGSIVRCRNREWVLLPSEEEGVIALRPLTAAGDEVIKLHERLTCLVGYDLPEERVQPATFPLPTVEDLSDAASAHLLWQAARLTLREGASPLRSLGRISIRPRVYQFVPLMMALGLDPIRLLIADDVGVGKTIEALLIARELWDRGEIRRLAVLCPPYLCDQWQKELTEKANLEAVIVRSGTVSTLDRNKPPDRTIYEHYPVQVISIDWVKSERNRHQFLLHCPEFVIVDEAHGAARASSLYQQQRHELVQEVAREPSRHLVLLTATPHSGIEEAFRSLLSLLRREFGQWNVSDMDETQLKQLARHLVQRTRRDIESQWEGEPCFPKREPVDATYTLSTAYRHLFDEVFKFCRGIVRGGQTLQEHRRRMRWWGALALLRSVMSSPRAAQVALQKRRKPEGPAEADEAELASYAYEPTDLVITDEAPTPAVERMEADVTESERRALRRLEAAAGRIGEADDRKLAGCVQTVESLLSERFQPVVWCHFVDTAEYVAEKLASALKDRYPSARVQCITGRIGDEERRTLINELMQEPQRVLVATDCLSEGINLQDGFNAVLHYDLPWNPNRLEQREGRVDRYGQKPGSIVKAVRYYGKDNPVDAAVIRVLLDKAREIHRTLGTHVPVPKEDRLVVEALVNELFFGREQPEAKQLRLGFEEETVDEFHRKWSLDAERERESRTRFDQHALKPEEINRELEAADAVLGDPNAVREFVLSAAQRIRLRIERDRKRADVFRVFVSPEDTSLLPDVVRLVLPQRKSGVWHVSFVSPTPEGAEYLGRNHRFVATLARFLVEEALERGGRAHAARCGVIRTGAVSRLTTILLLRVRYLIQLPGRTPLLSEEVRVVGHAGLSDGTPAWLEDGEALRLLAEAQPDANVPMQEKRELTARALEEWPSVEQAVAPRIEARARELEQAHRRIRQAVSSGVPNLEVVPQMPPDLLGLLVLQPMVRA